MHKMLFFQNWLKLIWDESLFFILPFFPHRSKLRLIVLHWLELLLKIFFYGFRNKLTDVNIFKINKVNLQLITGCRLLPWDCCEFLFQCLNVSELNRLPSSSRFNHLTLKGEPKQVVHQV